MIPLYLSTILIPNDPVGFVDRGLIIPPTEN